MPGEVEQLLEPDDAEGAGPLEQGMQQVAGGEDVGERPVGGLVGESEGGRQGAEFAVGHHVPDQAAGQGEGVDGGVGQAVATGGLECMVEDNFKVWFRKYSGLPKKILFVKLNRKLLGYYNYYGVTGNFQSLNNFVYQATSLLFKWLNWRSQRKSYNWQGFKEMVKYFGIAKPRILHAF